MNTQLKRGLHLVALTALGIFALSAGRFSGIAGAANPTPIPVSTCTTLANAAYRLTTNISASGTCFIVTNNTSLDLAGHTVTGNGIDFGVWDGNATAPNVAISNGTIT